MILIPTINTVVVDVHFDPLRDSQLLADDFRADVRDAQENPGPQALPHNLQVAMLGAADALDALAKVVRVESKKIYDERKQKKGKTE